LSKTEELKLTYYLKDNVACPVCERQFVREELLSGRGRLIAGKLTDELRRLYEPSKKYGKVNPLNYPIAVCPDCLFAVYIEDFKKLPEANIEIARSHTDKRVQMIMQTFGPLSFEEKRNDLSGAASYILAVSSYSYFEKNVSPTLKKGLSALRAAWVLGDLKDLAEEGENTPDAEKFGYIQDIMYRRSLEFYDKMLTYSQSGHEVLDGMKLGPDMDKDWGYQGFLYTVSTLRFKLGFMEKDLEKRAKMYLETKRVISKLFGRGKASKSKPSEILDMSRDLYDKFSQYISEIEEELGISFE